MPALPENDRKMARRAFLSGAAGVLGPTFAPTVVRADVDPNWRPTTLDVREVVAGGPTRRRFVLGIPRDLPSATRLPLLVLLHGLGETGDERAGAWAWFERYGLGTSYDRVQASNSFHGLVLACPYMPNLGADSVALDGYARYITEVVVAQTRKLAPVLEGPNVVYLAGCSLGGRISLDVMLRRPDTFAAWAGVQTAISAAAGDRYAQELQVLASRGGARPMLVETSTLDPFREGNEALSHGLTRSGVAHTFVELPGPHDQRWLRESGTIKMLQWFGDLPASASASASRP